MAKRTIKTEFGLTGEAAYKAAISEINKGISVLNSEMTKCTARFADNADSMEALTAKNDILERKLLSQKEKVEELRKAYQESAKANGESNKSTQDWLISLNRAEAELYKTEHEISRNNESMAQLEPQTKELTDKFSLFKSESIGLGDALESVGSKLGVKLPEAAKEGANGLLQINPVVAGVAGGIAGLVTGIIKLESKLVDISKASAQSADDLLTLSAKTGIAVEKLQAFQFAENLVDISSDALGDSLKDVTNKMADAANGNEELKGRFDELGVSIYDADGKLRDSYSVFLDVIDALGEMENRTERDALAMKLINESAQQLNPLIDAGTESLRAYTEQAEEMGYILSEQDTRAIQSVSDAQEELLKQQEAVTKQISTQYAPYMHEALDATKTDIKRIGDALYQSKAVDSLGSILDSTVSLVDPLVQLGTEVIPVISVALKGVAGVLAPIADALTIIEGILTLNGSLIKQGLGLNYSSGSPNNIQRYLGAQSYEVDENGWYIEPSYNASGNYNFSGGWTSVSENGGEDVILPRGTRILTAQESRKNRGGNTTVINANINNLETLQAMLRWFEMRQVEERMA